MKEEEKEKSSRRRRRRRWRRKAEEGEGGKGGVEGGEGGGGEEYTAVVRKASPLQELCSRLTTLGNGPTHKLLVTVRSFVKISSFQIFSSDPTYFLNGHLSLGFLLSFFVGRLSDDEIIIILEDCIFAKSRCMLCIFMKARCTTTSLLKTMEGCIYLTASKKEILAWSLNPKLFLCKSTWIFFLS